jgi:hypothetical protein
MFRIVYWPYMWVSFCQKNKSLKFLNIPCRDLWGSGGIAPCIWEERVLVKGTSLGTIIPKPNFVILSSDWATVWAVRVQFPAGAGIYPLRHRLCTPSGAHPVSYPMGTRIFSQEVKAAGRETDHSPPSSAEIKNAWSYTSTPPYVFIVWCLIKHGCVFTAWNLVKHRDNFTFALDGGGFTSGGKVPSTSWIEGWVGPRASLDAVAKGKIPSSLPGIEPRSSSP